MILITGASGLVGRSIFNRFSSTDEIIGTAFSAKDDQLESLDLTKDADVRDFVGGYPISAVIHCAACRPSMLPGKTEIDCYKDNIKILTNLINNLSNSIRFINIGATSIYGLGGTGALSEGAPIDCETFYQLSKKHAEDLLNLFFRRTKNLLNIRISAPYDVGRENNSILYRFIRSAMEDKQINVWGSGRRRQAFTNTIELAKALKVLFDRHAFGDFNYVTTASVSMMELAAKIQRHIKGVQIISGDQADPEEDCRTTIDTHEISKFVEISDTLDNDIVEIIGRLSK